MHPNRFALCLCVLGCFGTSTANACLVTSAAGAAVSDCLSTCLSETATTRLAGGALEPAGLPEGVAIDAPSLLLSGVPAGGESVVSVHVFSNDFSANPAGQPIVDPTINAGDTVHWVFDSAFHSTTSATAQAEAWDSGVFTSAGATFDHTFTVPGAYNYFCSIHGFDAGNGTAGGMSGVITVLAVPEPTSLLCAILPLASRRRR